MIEFTFTVLEIQRLSAGVTRKWYGIARALTAKSPKNFLQVAPLIVGGEHVSLPMLSSWKLTEANTQKISAFCSTILLLPVFAEALVKIIHLHRGIILVTIKLFIILVIFCGCGGFVHGGRGNQQVWVEMCAEECRDSPREVTILERDGSESRMKIAIITISPPYICRCE